MALNGAGYWAELVDREFRHAFTTDELRLSWGEPLGLSTVPLGAFYFGEEASAVRLAAAGGPNTIESQRTQFAAIGGWALTDVPGGRDALSEMVASELRELVDGLAPLSAPAVSFVQTSTGFGRSTLEVWATGVRIRAADGRLAGTAVLYKPAVGMATLGAVAVKGDLEHFARMLGVSQPARRPAAILFADLEASSSLARRLSTAGYFAVGRRFVGAADRCIVDRGGLVGRHVGDGVGRVLPRRDRGVGVGGGASLHRRGSRSAARDGGRGGAQRAGRTTTLSCASGCTGGPPPMSGGSRRPGAARSPRSATRSTRPPGSRLARREAGCSRRRTSSSGSTRTTRRRSASTRTA